MKYPEGETDKPVCLECGDVIGYGRTDKKFCSEKCKNRWHNRKQHNSRTTRARVVGILDKNYSILDRLLKLGITTMSLGDLAQLGYNKEIVTSYHKVGSHDEYRCFEIRYYCTATKIFNLERVNPTGL
jgi:predicted nucleic acid-binding Zn ribbon protein